MNLHEPIFILFWLVDLQSVSFHPELLSNWFKVGYFMVCHLPFFPKPFWANDGKQHAQGILFQYLNISFIMNKRTPYGK
jgi:hypothetical protein